MTTTPNNLKNEAHSILTELPHVYIALANADSANATSHLINSVRQVHREIATVFGEPRPTNIGVMQVAEDLTRWINVWTFHPHAERWVAQLRHTLHMGDQEAGDSETSFRWIEKGDAVCPKCLSIGHLEYQETTWDHRCPHTDTVWQWQQYRAAIREVLAQHKGAA